MVGPVAQRCGGAGSSGCGAGSAPGHYAEGVSSLTGGAHPDGTAPDQPERVRAESWSRTSLTPRRRTAFHGRQRVPGVRGGRRDRCEHGLAGDAVEVRACPLPAQAEAMGHRRG
ncbi:hypothetical protein GCM10010345_60930 [Streptomyces canarius]|uniref:Uncharacterized protein n=1 Tax=Streptomyces canarius TaxID=285453 RepID=A0ABQ3CYM0_9ACTN|nr:hypothetical protein GCM10010345_60930 [Streptomyces canarius]